MKINTRETCGYVDVNIASGDAVIDLGFHDASQAKELLASLKKTCEDLQDYIERKEGA
jgi:hypothetical protein